MASPSAPDHQRPQMLFGGGSAFYPIEEIPTVAPIPMELPTRPSHATRSRAATTRAGMRSVTDPVALPDELDASRSKERKRSTSTSTPRKRLRTAMLKKAPSRPETDEDDERKPAATESCCICMCDVDNDDLAGISGCSHKFCFECIEKWAERENSCPLCKVRFTKIDRVNKKKKKGQKNSKRVKQRDQRTDIGPGAALEGLLGEHSRIFNLLFVVDDGLTFSYLL